MVAWIKVDDEQFQHVTNLPFETCDRKLDRKKSEQIIWSEGWHNRFETSTFNFHGEIQKEQADIESMLTHVSQKDD